MAATKATRVVAERGSALERWFALTERRTDIGTEVRAGLRARPLRPERAMGAGIGLFLFAIGAYEAGLFVVPLGATQGGTIAPPTAGALGTFTAPPVVLAIVGLVITAALLQQRVRGAI